jgi:hypothetical protein
MISVFIPPIHTSRVPRVDLVKEMQEIQSLWESNSISNPNCHMYGNGSQVTEIFCFCGLDKQIFCFLIQSGI